MYFLTRLSSMVQSSHPGLKFLILRARNRKATATEATTAKITETTNNVVVTREDDLTEGGGDDMVYPNVGSLRLKADKAENVVFQDVTTI